MPRMLAIAFAILVAVAARDARATGSPNVVTHVQCSQIIGRCTHTEITYVWGVDAQGNVVMIVLTTRTWHSPYRRLP